MKKNKKYHPSIGEVYFSLQYVQISDVFRPDEYIWTNSCYDKSRLDLGLVFQTEQESRVECERRNYLLYNSDIH